MENFRNLQDFQKTLPKIKEKTFFISIIFQLRKPPHIRKPPPLLGTCRPKGGGAFLSGKISRRRREALKNEEKERKRERKEEKTREARRRREKNAKNDVKSIKNLSFLVILGGRFTRVKKAPPF